MDYAENYVIIGGTACSELNEEEGLKPRVTKDIDAILIVEALSDEFVKRFWEFIRAGEHNFIVLLNPNLRVSLLKLNCFQEYRI